MADADAGRWNHNLHHHGLLLAAVPEGCEHALDVGCGEGVLARRLAARVPHVTAIDRDAPTLALARAQDGSSGVRYVLGDVMAYDFGAAASFDYVVAVAVLHHLDPATGLARLASLVAPGGRLAVLGLTRPRWPHDLPRWVAGGIAHRALRARRGWWESAAPIAPPTRTFPELRALARRTLPGPVALRRHVLWRYSLVWDRPR